MRLIYFSKANYRQVAIFIDDKYFCGGSLISADWVLTAARKFPMYN